VVHAEMVQPNGDRIVTTYQTKAARRRLHVSIPPPADVTTPLGKCFLFLLLLQS
jgi:hypothetical protein